MNSNQQKDWKAEKANKLHTLCTRIETFVKQGMTIKAAVRKACGGRRWKAKLRSNGKQFSLSQRTVANYYRAWKHSPQPATVRPRYRPGVHSIITPEIVLEVGHRALGAESLIGVYKSLELDWLAGFSLPGVPRTLAARYKTIPFSYRAMRDALPLTFKKQLRGHYAARRKLLTSLSKSLCQTNR